MEVYNFCMLKGYFIISILTCNVGNDIRSNWDKVHFCISFPIFIQMIKTYTWTTLKLSGIISMHFPKYNHWMLNKVCILDNNIVTFLPSSLVSYSNCHHLISKPRYLLFITWVHTLYLFFNIKDLLCEEVCLEQVSWHGSVMILQKKMSDFALKILSDYNFKNIHCA